MGDARRASVHVWEGDFFILEDYSVLMEEEIEECFEVCETRKFLNRYKVDSARAEWWDYGNDGFYFITICTFNRLCLFGQVQNDIMELSSIGELVSHELKKSFEIREELIHHITTIMPNHIHLIIQIKKSSPRYCRDARRASPKQGQNTGIAYRSPKSISSFIAGFKSSVTKQASINQPIWQPRFHDHIIKNKKEYANIYRYIQNNPKMWNNDTFNPKKR